MTKVAEGGGGGWGGGISTSKSMVYSWKPDQMLFKTTLLLLKRLFRIRILGKLKKTLIAYWRQYVV